MVNRLTAIAVILLNVVLLPAAGTREREHIVPVSYTHLTLPTILLV